MGKQILAVDIGGTSSRFAHFELMGPGKLESRGSTWLKTKEAKSFGELLSQLGKSNFSLKVADADIAVIAIAGPVEDGVFCSPPLIEWDVDLHHAEKDFGLKHFALINDFLAQAFACRSEIGRRAALVLPGPHRENAPVAVLGAGTGLGKAFLLPDGKGGFVGGSSEGGHTNFCAETDHEFEFQKFMTAKQGGGYLTWNDVVSGRGLSFIHEFLTKENLEPHHVASKLVEGSETLAWSSRLYGRVCRNFALETLCFGGFYIAGGVAAKNPILVKHPEFKQAFHDSRVHRHVLEQFPVRLNDNEESGLWGAAFYGCQQLQTEG